MGHPTFFFSVVRRTEGYFGDEPLPVIVTFLLVITMLRDRSERR
jgi:hypothetical protein